MFNNKFTSITSGKNKVLFVKSYLFNAKTVANDLDILKERFDVYVYDSKLDKGFSFILSFIHQLIYCLFNVWKFKLVYIWFADYHSMLPVLFAKLYGRKSIVNVGGYDATDIPEINCGAFNGEGFKNKFRRWCLEYTFNNCSYIFTVDDSMILNRNTYIFSGENRILNDGIKNYMPGLKTKIETVFTGYDVTKFERGKNIQKERLVISVGLTPNENEFKRKGFDILIEAAKRMNDTNFILIGLSKEQIEKARNLKLANLIVETKVPQNVLIEYFSRAKVCAQLSLFEGLPNTLCEAMLCECVPVGSNVNGIPTAIGDTGFIVNKKDIIEVKENLNKALAAPESLGIKARERIIKYFDISLRRKKINKIIDGLVNENS